MNNPGFASNIFKCYFNQLFALLILSAVVAMVQRMVRRTIVSRNVTHKMEEQLEKTYILGFGYDLLSPNDYGANVWTIK